MAKKSNYSGMIALVAAIIVLVLLVVMISYWGNPQSPVVPSGEGVTTLQKSEYPVTVHADTSSYTVAPGEKIDVVLIGDIAGNEQYTKPTLESVKLTLDVPAFVSTMEFTPAENVAYAINQVDGKFLLFVYNINAAETGATTIGTLNLSVLPDAKGEGNVLLYNEEGTLKINELTGRDDNREPHTFPITSGTFFHISVK